MGVTPAVVVSDNDAAFRKARALELPESKHLLCHWHVSSNVKARTMDCLSDEKHRTKFMEAFNKLLHCNDAEAADKLWAETKTSKKSREGRVSVNTWSPIGWLLRIGTTITLLAELLNMSSGLANYWFPISAAQVSQHQSELPSADHLAIGSGTRALIR